MGLFSRTPRHRHDYQLVAVNDIYHMEDSQGQKTYFQMRFYKCECGSRHYSDNRPQHIYHKGMDTAKKNWIDVGVMPKQSYHPEDNKYFVKLDDLDREKIDPVLAYQKTLEEISKTLGVVINRDFGLEERYPKLKEAADEYHRQLDKYRNFETLKKKDGEDA